MSQLYFFLFSSPFYIQHNAWNIKGVLVFGESILDKRKLIPDAPSGKNSVWSLTITPNHVICLHLHPPICS